MKMPRNLELEIIQKAAKDAGSHWFDRETVKGFGSKVVACHCSKNHNICYMVETQSGIFEKNRRVIILRKVYLVPFKVVTLAYCPTVSSAKRTAKLLSKRNPE